MNPGDGEAPPAYRIRQLEAQLKELVDREERHCREADAKLERLHKENAEKIDRLTEKVVHMQATLDMLVKAAWLVFGGIALAVIGGVMGLVINREPAKAAQAGHRPLPALASPMGPPQPVRRADGRDQ